MKSFISSFRFVRIKKIWEILFSSSTRKNTHSYIIFPKLSKNFNVECTNLESNSKQDLIFRHRARWKKKLLSSVIQDEEIHLQFSFFLVFSLICVGSECWGRWLYFLPLNRVFCWTYQHPRMGLSRILFFWSNHKQRQIING